MGGQLDLDPMMVTKGGAGGCVSKGDLTNGLPLGSPQFFPTVCSFLKTTEKAQLAIDIGPIWVSYYSGAVRYCLLSLERPVLR